MKFDKSLRVPLNCVFSYEILNQYTSRVRWMIDDIVSLIHFTKQVNSQLMNSSDVKLTMVLNIEQHQRMLNYNKHLIPTKDELLKQLRELQAMYIKYIILSKLQTHFC